MKYLDEKSIDEIGIDWHGAISVIENAVFSLEQEDYSQPIKPYLRYGDKRNRIIAMPAYIGGETHTAGIKWISSFPSNIENGIQRAHATVVLNEADTGKPFCIINAGSISAIRTASVSGLYAKKYFEKTSKTKVDVGIIGFGPIGKMHLDMILAVGQEKLGTIYMFDLKGINFSGVPAQVKEKIVEVKTWEELFDRSEILMTCTVSSERYINKKGRKGTLHLNVSLRDYCDEFMLTVDEMIVDNWNEICRENTDIEFMHLNHGLNKEDVYEMSNEKMDEIFNEVDNKVIMFNPMGMAIFDMAISKYYYQCAVEKSVGVDL